MSRSALTRFSGVLNRLSAEASTGFNATMGTSTRGFASDTDEVRANNQDEYMV